MTHDQIKAVIKQMTIEEKASLTSGLATFTTKDIKRLGIPSLVMADGPHGLRKPKGNGIGMDGSSTATCFPTAACLANSWDLNVLEKTGKAIAKQAKALGVHILLAPGTNIKRSPLCGRNFEYFSEDPLLSSSLAKSYIIGVQHEGVGTSLKHFLANNQEYHRNTASSEISERALREIYLASFEKAVIEAKPKTIMCSYNKINGVHASENKRFMTDILRDEWQYEGMVISDWGATHHRVNALSAGTDLTMPSDTNRDSEIVKAVQSGVLSEEVLDQAVYRLLKTINETYHENTFDIDFDVAHQLAKEVACESGVLLKNDDNILPLKDHEHLLFVGGFANQPRYQGNGSSKVNSYKASSIVELVKDNQNISYAQGFSIKNDQVDESLEQEALLKASKADRIIVFAGLPDAFESEGFDRDHMQLPHNQNELIKKLSLVNPHIVVVLYHGSPVEMPWVHQVKAILTMYLGGEAVADATLDLLFGKVNPSGKLAESFPIRVEDNPSYLDFLGTHDVVHYYEDVYVGYRYYVTKKMHVNFPFGHGLSYTEFTYSNLKINKSQINDQEQFEVSVDVTNTGNYFGKEVVQLYIEAKTDQIKRPLRELRAFDKISLQPKETKTVTFILDSRSLSYWHERAHKFHVESGQYLIQINQSSEQVILEETIDVEGEWIQLEPYSDLSLISDVLKHPKGKAFLDQILPIVMQVLKKMNYLGSDPFNDEKAQKKQSEKKGLLTQPVSLLKQFTPHLSEEDWNKFYQSLNE